MKVAGEAEDGLEALQLVQTLSPQIVITDMRMPGSDGVQLLRNLNDQYPNIKVIVFSGYDDFTYAKHALRYRAVDYLLKPIDPLELNDALRKCKDELEAGTQTPPTFDLEISRKLSAYKQLLRGYFNELNVEGIQEIFARITRELDESCITHPQQLGSLVQEILLTLKDLMMVNSLAAEAFVPVIKPADVISNENAMIFLAKAYTHALEQLIQIRKYKNKLNLDDVRVYVERHFAETITLEQLAKAFFVSKEYLSKVFKQEYGRSFTDYILHLRMDKAKEWLQDEQIPIRTIAEMTGYEDISYFYRVFKKHFGIAPGEMRKNP
ncbi:putative response regulatory protein [compost metagenome]